MKAMKKKSVTASRAMRLITTRPTIIITTLHPNGEVNGGAFGAYTNLSPKEIGLAIGTPSHTYRNLKRTGEFVINVPGADLVDAISIFGSDAPDGVSEVVQAGLTTAKSAKVAVPYIAECVASVECRFLREVPIGYHSFVIGEVLCGWVNDGLLDDEGYFDVVKAGVLHGARYPQPVYAVFSCYIHGK